MKTACIEFIKEAHEGQTYGDAPYWTHPVEVEITGRSTFGSLWDETAALTALLHDVIEDTRFDAADLLRMGYNNAVIDAVELVTKVEFLGYVENIARIVNSGNVTAMMVKYADNKVNASTRKEGIPDYAAKKLQAKYEKSMTTLRVAIETQTDTTAVVW